MIPTNYTVYHLHSMLSNGTTNIDSITDFHDYVDIAKKLGMKAMAFSEHGSMFGWLKKKEYIESCGMKYIHAVEAYLTEDNDERSHLFSAANLLDQKANRIQFNKSFQDENGDWYAKPIDDYRLTQINPNTIKDEGYKKERDNYHVVLIAKNYEGEKELNKLISKSYYRDDYHFYYMPRISFDELFATSDNIIVTTACLGGALFSGTPTAKEKLLAFLQQNKHRCFLEIQHHDCADQIKYNRLLYELHKKLDVPLIAGTDTHAINEEHMEGRAILQAGKGVHFSNEDEWDLTFKSLPELIAAYKKQNSIPMEAVYEAIENTNVMAAMVEEFKVDYSPKYPKLYDNSEEVFKQKINEGVKKRGIQRYPNYQKYVDRIKYEYEVYKHNGAIDFMLLEENYKSAMRAKNVKYGYSRGSVSGSIIAYLLYITEIDSVKYNLNFSRFMNVERVSLADIDTDWLSSDRKLVKDYLYSKEGLYCCDIVTFNTIALKGAIKDVCRGLYNINVEKLEIPQDLKQKINEWKKQIEGQDARSADVKMPKDLDDELNRIYTATATYKEVPYDYLSFADSLIALAEKDEEAARNKYPRVFKYVDMVNGVVVSVGNHPAGCVVSPYPVDEWFGTFTTSTDEYPISLLNMKEIDSLNFVKLDILGLDNIGLIYKTCEAAGIPFATPDNTPPDDEDVWESIKDDTTMIFQWESASATKYLKQLFSDRTIARIKAQNPNFTYMDLLSIGNGAIRPAGESYRDQLAQGIFKIYGNKALDDFMAPTLGWCVYQEQIIEFLHTFCGYTMGEADIVRRGFAKKTGTEKFIPKIKEGFKKTMAEKYGVSEEVSDKLIVNFIQVIEDASSYLFSKNHADPYSWIGYICGYLRYYYPLEFISTALNIFADNEEKSLAIIDYAKRHEIKILPIRFRYSTANYSFNKADNTIYKGIASIKFLNETIANELYALREVNYNSFIELLVDIKNKTAINRKQLRILIDLDFFAEFGDANYLNRLVYYYDEFEGRLQIKKDKLKALNIDFDSIRPFAEKETEAMFTKINSIEFLKSLAPTVKVKKRTLRQKIEAQIEYLGYLDIADARYSKMLAILSIDTKYAPRVKAYSLRNGTTIECKITKRVFNQHKFQKGDIIRVTSQQRKPKMKRLENGEYEPIPDTTEIWLLAYDKIDAL